MSKDNGPIVVKKKGVDAVKYSPSKNLMGNVLPEAEVVGFTGSEKTQERKKKLYNAQKKLASLRNKLRSRISKRESK